MNWETSFTIFGKVIPITPWEIFGFLGVSMFTARWFVQIYYSHLEGKPVTPRIFWVISMVGSLLTLTYYLFRPGNKFETVGVLGNLFPSFISGYNLYLDLTHRRVKSKSAVAGMERPRSAGDGSPKYTVKTIDARTSGALSPIEPAAVND